MLVVAGGGGGVGGGYRGGSAGGEVGEEGSLGNECGDNDQTTSSNNNGGGAGTQTSGGDSYTQDPGSLTCGASCLYQRRAVGDLLMGGNGMDAGGGWSGPHYTGMCYMSGAGGWPNGGGGFHGCGNGGGGGGGWYGGGGGSYASSGLGNSGGGGGGSSFPTNDMANANPAVQMHSVYNPAFPMSGDAVNGESDPDYNAASIGTFPSLNYARVAHGGKTHTGSTSNVDGGPGLVVIEAEGVGKTVFTYTGTVQAYTVPFPP